MNHWDLRPGETVTLERQRDQQRVEARFTGRATLWGRFLIAGKPQYFDLLDDGQLSREEYLATDDNRVWPRRRGYRILGERENSRAVVASVKGLIVISPCGLRPVRRSLNGSSGSGSGSE
jgi:hypothetical protein